MDESGRGLEQMDERVQLQEDVQRAKQLRVGIQQMRELQVRTSEAVEQARALCADADAKLREACEALDRLAGEVGQGGPQRGS